MKHNIYVHYWIRTRVLKYLNLWWVRKRADATAKGRIIHFIFLWYLIIKHFSFGLSFFFFAVFRSYWTNTHCTNKSKNKTHSHLIVPSCSVCKWHGKILVAHIWIFVYELYGWFRCVIRVAIRRKWWAETEYMIWNEKWRKKINKYYMSILYWTAENIHSNALFHLQVHPSVVLALRSVGRMFRLFRSNYIARKHSQLRWCWFPCLIDKSESCMFFQLIAIALYILINTNDTNVEGRTIWQKCMWFQRCECHSLTAVRK